MSGRVRRGGSIVACTHLLLANRTVLDEVPGKRSVIVANLLSFLKSDTACIRSPDKEIAALQDETLGPLVKWFQAEFNTPLTVDNSFTGKEQPEDTITVVQWHLFKLDDW